MPSQILYLSIDILVVIVPLVFSFHPRIRFDKEWRNFIPANIITGMIFIAWDIWFTAAGVWNFNPAYVTGLNLFGLPVEEILFFFSIPYACLFTLHAFQKLYPSFRIKWRTVLISVLFIVSVCTSVIWRERIYSFYAFGSFAVILLVMWFTLRERSDHFFLMYLVILLPFFIVNGILTGMFIEGEVVSYNDTENLNIRMLTIPVEDAFYGMTLLMLHFILMEAMRRWRDKKDLKLSAL